MSDTSTTDGSTETTTIWLHEPTADRLYEHKSRGQTYDDVIRDLLDDADDTDRGDAAGPPSA